MGPKTEELRHSGLAKRLKEGTRVAHQAAEQVRFVHEFIKGNIKRESYCQLLVNLHYVYQALEQEFDKHARHEVLEPIYFPVEIHRSEALAADVRFFCGNQAIKPSAAAMQYVERLHDIGDTRPELLVSHAYTRYMGDLSGGQILKRALIRSFKLADSDDGSQFYNFSAIEDLKAFKNRYRQRLDNLPADESLVVQMVEEANVAFELNRQMFIELDEQGFCHTPSFDCPIAPEVSCKGKCAACPFASLATAAASLSLGHPKIQKTAEFNSQQCPLRLLSSSAPKFALWFLPIGFGIICSAFKVQSHAKLLSR